MFVHHLSMMWKGAAVAIIGGGPSLSQTDVRLCRKAGCRTIGVNDAYKFGTDIDITFFGDSEWYWGTAHHPGHFGALQQWPGMRITCDPRLKDEPRLICLKRWQGEGIVDFPQLKLYRNSGASAIALAVMMGASRIYLLGFDGTKRQGKHNWHEDNVHTIEDSIYLKHQMQMSLLAEDVRRYPYNPSPVIWNCTPGSAYDCFTDADLTEVLK